MNQEIFDKNYIPEPNSGCWLWTGRVNHSGYGRYGKRSIGAHRISYEMHIGKIPKGLCVLHQCDTPACVNPEHLSLGSHGDNCADKVRKRRHAYGEKNGQAKLTSAAVVSIRSDPRSNREVAATYDISPTQVGEIRNRLWWKHVA